MLKDPFNLSGKVAMVTGAGQGLGKEFALALANAGADVVVAEINAESGPQTVEQIAKLERRGRYVQTDMTKLSSVEAAVQSTVEAWGRLDVLVNNAGITIWGEAECVPIEQWHEVVDLDLNGVYYGCRAAAPAMIERGGGSIINVASMSGLIVNVPQCQASYNAAKAAVIQLTRSLAVEWAKYHIRVNAISPGYMATSMVLPHLKDPETGGEWLQRTPMGRAGHPEELGPLCVYLASDGSSYMTGSNVIIDGGYTAV